MSDEAFVVVLLEVHVAVVMLKASIVHRHGPRVQNAFSLVRCKAPERNITILLAIHRVFFRRLITDEIRKRFCR